MNEFDIIETFFTKQPISRNDVILGVGDDCAITEVPADQQLVITTDTLISGVHFPENTSAYDIGYKSLAVNLSDLAAMGSTPAWITLALTLSDANEKWLSEFSQGIFDLTKRYNVQLIGGDLTHGSLSVTIQAFGLVKKNQAIRRSTAQPGDLIYVTHTLGDAALGLLIVQNKMSVSKKIADHFIAHLNRPEPRIEIGKSLLGIANAAIDISDGLAADLGHILKLSQVGARIYVDQLPLSAALRESVSSSQAIALALNGGDDYELCFTVPKEKQNLLKEGFTCIGVITEDQTLDLRYQDGSTYNGLINGYRHF